MDKEDIELLQDMVEEYGARGALKGFILALRDAADLMSDMRLKERATEAADLAEVLQKVDDALEE
jgi:hypothetical protein